MLLPRLLFLALLLLPSFAWADLTGKVVAVADGDTITVLHDLEGASPKPIKVRLFGIDAPVLLRSLLSFGVH